MNLNELVIVEFWDHGTGKDLARCRAVGFVEYVDQFRVTLRTWELFAGDYDPEANCERISICRMAITSYEIVKRAPGV